ncbi:LuxR C-terminal-related transcriptional regulator [Bacteroidales bacterium]|nr:LuxR C-terminal-related transcriptional regulator [Bacteroidales bacterium]
MEYLLNQLKARQLKNLEGHQCDVTDVDYKRIEPIIALLKRLSEIEHSIYEVYDMHRRDYILKSDAQKKVFGLTNEDDRVDTEYIYKHIHPNDLEFVLDTDEKVYRFYSKLTPSEKKDFKLVYDFRIKNSEGIYMRFMHQSVVLETGVNGKAWLILVITDLLMEKARDEKPQRRLINTKTGKQHLFTHDEQEMILTKRETEIISFIARGYDSKSIAENLFISVNTVNNHRQNILRKTRSDNTTKAMLYCKRIGLI